MQKNHKANSSSLIYGIDCIKKKKIKRIMNSKDYIPSQEKYSKSWDNLFKAKKTFKIIIMVGSAGHQ